MYPVKANGIRTGEPRGLGRGLGRSSKLRVGSRVRQTHEEAWRTYRPKRCGNSNKDEDNSLKTVNDKINRFICGGYPFIYNCKQSSIFWNILRRAIYLVLLILWPVDLFTMFCLTYYLPLFFSYLLINSFIHSFIIIFYSLQAFHSCVTGIIS